ncbi:exodeoxyribonuclease 7 small subunit [Companilactobacillus sp. RD055328]|uniref:exodeoxyribonuclease VII small subunit n=1 Tax=Companilactobacillus sp. RD055328 TaxID=2916634 RepID=UPI001FC7C3D8|nr:exodeoxyribonuclease VII small subunit [Companilactobacillus sp. RD055328]GKQ42555.1 exodeoxyribonuclease 7 small subunit [Companilactobacillus sp. RD055328]
MTEKKFEDNMKKLETIVAELEQGDVPLEEAMKKFQTGIELSNSLEKTLKTAEKTLTKVMTDDNTERNIDDTITDAE